MKTIVGLTIAALVMHAAVAAPCAAQSQAENAPDQPIAPVASVSPPGVVMMPRIDIFGGLTLLRLVPGTDLDRTGLAGWQAALTMYPFKGDRSVSRLGFAAEVVGAQRTPTLDDTQVPGTKVELTENTFLFGPTLRLIRRERFSSNLRMLLGVARLRTSFPADLTQAGIASGATPGSIGVFNDENVFAASVGSAWEIRVSRLVAVRVNPSLLITRFHGGTQLTQRFSTGLVFRWYGQDGGQR
jgi:hypothetical protein